MNRLQELRRLARELAIASMELDVELDNVADDAVPDLEIVLTASDIRDVTEALKATTERLAAWAEPKKSPGGQLDTEKHDPATVAG